MTARAEVLDPAAVERLRRLGGDEFLVEMIDLFLDNGPKRLASVRQGVASDEAREVQRAAHSLKSTAGNLGGRAVQETAQEIETRAADGKMDGLPSLLDELDARFQALLERLERERTRRA